MWYLTTESRLISRVRPPWPEVPFWPWKAHCTWGCGASPEGPKRSVGAAERLDASRPQVPSSTSSGQCPADFSEYAHFKAVANTRGVPGHRQPRIPVTGRACGLASDHPLSVRGTFVAERCGRESAQFVTRTHACADQRRTSTPSRAGIPIWRAAGLLRRQHCGRVRAANAPPATRSLSAAAGRALGLCHGTTRGLRGIATRHRGLP